MNDIKMQAELDEADREIITLTSANSQLRAMVAELIDVYWGEGDSDPCNPPDIIRRAKRLLKS